MPSPIPVPSKAAIHALRGIAFGTSCAIGVILEDQRRRINILKTAVANGEKIKAAKRYHGAPTIAMPHEEPGIWEGDGSHQHLRSDKPQNHDRPRKYRDFTLPKEDIQENSTQPLTPGAEPEVPSESPSRTTAQISRSKIKYMIPPINVNLAPVKKIRSRDEFATAIDIHLKSDDEEGLDRALTEFFDGSRLCYSFRKFDDGWIAIAVELSQACQEKSRLSDAAKVIITTIDAGPLDESQFYDLKPIPVMNSLLDQRDKDGRCPPEAINIATRIYFAKFKARPLLYGPEMGYIAKRLFTHNASIKRIKVLHFIIYRAIPPGACSGHLVGWFIQRFYERQDYKSVIRYFVLSYAKMITTDEDFNTTVDCVISAVEELKGHRAELVLESLRQMHRPGEEGRVRTRWIMKTLHAFWSRDEDFAATKKLFESILSSGLIDLSSHPEGVYRSMVEISIKAKNDDMTRFYCEELIQRYPEMLQSVDLKGVIAAGAANAGNWDAVFDAFREMQAIKKGQEEEYDEAFVVVLKIFAETHSATEVRDFVSKYTTDLGVRLHRYVVTLVSRKFGECRDISGFVSWLAYCCKAGFALDSGICNSILYNCWTILKFPYPQLLELYSKLRLLGPSLTDDVTRRILSQAANIGKDYRRTYPSRGMNSRNAVMYELANKGKKANRRDVYEAMNRELCSRRPLTALWIYRRALESGMPPCEHCLRVAVKASSKSLKHGFERALGLIQSAYENGVDITEAMTVFIKLRLEQLQVTAQDLVVHMRNIVSQFEAVNIVVQPKVLTQMALMLVDVGHCERGISLCTFAMNQNGFKNLAFSRQSIRAMLNAFLILQDVDGMKQLCHDIIEGDFSMDKSTLSYLRSTKRFAVNRFREGTVRETMVDILDHTISKVVEKRAENRVERATISRETLRIMKEAVEDMQGNLKLEISDDYMY
ncbi:hypothetical protein F4805DRAFT_411559 [Annulohypoxylon moriforme]|nr:hypothetical protein F4805DRAFT_411559 [Annulohypoxylon moriforme]